LNFQTAAGNRVERLYHYQRFNPNYLAQTIKRNTIHFSNPSQFNDPWDCKPWFNKALDDPVIRERYVQWFDRIGRKHTPELTEAERQRRIRVMRSDREFLERMIDDCSRGMVPAIDTQYRVYCLSTTPVSTLMWSHYTDNHQGICLEFGVRNDVMCSALRVEYREGYPLFDLAAEDDYSNLLPFIAKSSVWEYEDEYRLIAQEEATADTEDTLKTKNNVLLLPRGALVSVIVGCSASQETIEEVKELVRSNGKEVALKRAVRAANRYALAIEPLA
jgi:hypothetical protein